MNYRLFSGEFSKLLVRSSKIYSTRWRLGSHKLSNLLCCAVYTAARITSLEHTYQPITSWSTPYRSSTCLMNSNYQRRALEILLRKKLGEWQPTSPLDLKREVCQVPPVPITSSRPKSPLLVQAQICLVLSFMLFLFPVFKKGYINNHFIHQLNYTIYKARICNIYITLLVYLRHCIKKKIAK